MSLLSESVHKGRSGGVAVNAHFSALKLLTPPFGQRWSKRQEAVDGYNKQIVGV